MSTTDELRRLLTDAGVEYGGSDAVVYFEDERGYKACAYDAPRRYGKGVLCVSHTATPAQAVAATLDESPCLPHFWTHDGTLHVELPKLPESISVRLPDQRDREVRSARVWQYTLGRGTCHNESEYPKMFFYCSECGCAHKRNRAYVDMPRFCPKCGRRVVE